MPAEDRRRLSQAFAIERQIGGREVESAGLLTVWSAIGNSPFTPDFAFLAAIRIDCNVAPYILS
jgi:hypothetical protein